MIPYFGSSIPSVRLYLKVPEVFVRLILQERFWVVHIPFGRMFKLQFLAQFPVDQFGLPLLLLLLLLLLVTFSHQY